MNFVGLPFGHKFTEQEKQDYFAYQLVAMVVEDCKIKWNIDGSKVYKRLKNCDAIKYLVEGYDCLHTQSMDYIISDIEEILESHEKEGAADEI